jgi:hypothetical protein
MVCFDLGNQETLFLFVAAADAVPAQGPEPSADYQAVGRLTTALWRRGDRVYLLAGFGGRDQLERHLSSGGAGPGG